MIGASNREDMIDPAILRPGRLDVKIKIERPDAESARDIFSKYLTTSLPLHADDLGEFGGDRDATRGRHDPGHGGADVHGDRREPLPRGDLRQRRQGGPVLQGLQLRRDDPEHRRPRQEDGDQGPPGDRPEGPAGAAPAAGLRRRVQGERGPARTPPTPTTGRGSPARRASGSSSSAPSSPASRAPSRVARSTTSRTPASTCRRACSPVVRRVWWWPRSAWCCGFTTVCRRTCASHDEHIVGSAGPSWGARDSRSTPSSGSLLRLEGRVASLTQRELGAADPGVEPARRRGHVGLPAAPQPGEVVHVGVDPGRAAPHLPGVVGAEAEVADVGGAGPDDLRGGRRRPSCR